MLNIILLKKWPKQEEEKGEKVKKAGNAEKAENVKKEEKADEEQGDKCY